MTCKKTSNEDDSMKKGALPEKNQLKGCGLCGQQEKNIAHDLDSFFSYQFEKNGLGPFFKKRVPELHITNYKG
jgi:hypothetical protein